MKTASMSGMSGVGGTTPSVGPRIGVNANQSAGPTGPIKTKKPGAGGVGTGSNAAQTVFGTIDGLSSASGGVEGKPPIGGVRPPWVQAVLGPHHVKTSAAPGPLTPTDGGPLGLPSPLTPSKEMFDASKPTIEPVKPLEPAAKPVGTQDAPMKFMSRFNTESFKTPTDPASAASAKLPIHRHPVSGRYLMPGMPGYTPHSPYPYGIAPENNALQPTLMTPSNLDLVVAPGVGRLLGSGVSRLATRFAPAAAEAAPAAAATSGMTTRIMPTAAEATVAATEAAPAVAETAPGLLGRLAAPRAAAKGKDLLDPAQWVAQGLGWVGRQALPGAVTGTANVLSRGAELAGGPVGSLLGTRSLPRLARGDVVGLAQDAGLRSLLHGAMGEKVQPLEPYTRAVETAQHLSQGRPQMAAGSIVGPVANLNAKLLQPGLQAADQAVGNTISTGDLSRLVDPAKAVGENVMTAERLVRETAKVKADMDAAGTPTTPEQAQEIASQRLKEQGATWTQSGNQPISGPTATDYLSNKLTGSPLKPVQTGTPTQPQPTQPTVDPVREFATKTAPETASRFNTAMASGDIAAAQKITQEHLQAAGGDPGRVMVSMLGRLGPDNFNMPEPQFKAMIDGPTPEPSGSLYDRFKTSGQALSQLEQQAASGQLPPDQQGKLSQARQQYAELNREVQGRAMTHYEQKVVPQLQREAPTLAADLTNYRQKVESGQPLTPQEAADMRQKADRGRAVVTNVSMHAFRKAQLDFGRADTPTPAAGNADVSTIADVYRQMNATKQVTRPDGTVTTEPAHPLGQQVQGRIAQELSAEGVPDAESNAKTLFGELGDLPKLLLYGGLGLTAVGGLGSAFGLFDGGPIMALLGMGMGLTGLAGGDPSKLITKDFWSNLPQTISQRFGGGGGGQPFQPPQAAGKAQAVSAPSPTLNDFFKQQGVPVGQDGTPQLPSDPTRLQAVIGAMSPRIKQESMRLLDDKVQRELRTASRGLLGRSAADTWQSMERIANGQKPMMLAPIPTAEQTRQAGEALRLRAMLKQGEFKPDLTPQELHELGVYGRMTAGTGPSMVGKTGVKDWLTWYKKYHAGERSDTDSVQISRWHGLKSFHAGRFAANPTPQKAHSLLNWAIDPYKLVTPEERTSLRQQMQEHQKQRTGKWLQGK